MKKQLIVGLGLVGMMACVSSCKKKDSDEATPTPVKSALNIPSAYESADYTSNTVSQNTVRTNLKNLVTELNKGKTLNTQLNSTTLTTLWTTGSPSLSSEATTSLSAYMGGWMSENVNASKSGSYHPDSSLTVNGDGGVYGGYLFDEYGVENQQLIEKGYYGGGLYNHAMKLIKGTITEATIDQLVSIYGASPAFPNSDADPTNPDVYSAKYAEKRDNKGTDNPGFYLRIKKNLITAKAAVKAGSEYNAERDAALLAFRQDWEKSNFATVVNYAKAASQKLSATSPSDADKASGLHSLSEAVAFVIGFWGIDQKDRIITDAQLQELLDLLNYDTSAATMYKFAQGSPTELAKLVTLQSKIKAIYGFSDAEMADFANGYRTR